MLNLNHKANRDLLAEMLYTRLNSAGKEVEVTRRGYAYDALGRPISRTQDYPQQKFAREDSFDYNKRSELTGATLGEAPYAYSYDNIGNRITAQEDAESVTYEANNLNQYTQIDTDGTAFVPEYDADGNQTRIQTVTGIWKVQYNGQNRAIRYESEADSTHIITCVYDSQGRRVEKKEEKEGAAISHVRYVYRGYLQVAAYDLLAEGLPSLWQIIWDPTQDIATRPLAIRADGAYSTYGWDLTKNICETYAGATGFLGHRYAYSPYGLVSLEGDTSYQPLQWSSEVYDEELGLNYYNYRYYNPGDGRWTRRDIEEFSSLGAMYGYLFNSPTGLIDLLGHRSQNSGTPPRYNPTNWNDEDTGGRYQWANNCYSYACDTRYDGNKINPSLRDYDGGYRPQPGEASGQGRKVKMNCKDIMRRATGDGLYILHEKCCKRGYHKVALVVGPGGYHWYRQDQGGMWSHKPGIDKVRNTDESGRPISNPEKADWGSLYDTFCGYMCAPDF